MLTTTHPFGMRLPAHIMLEISGAEHEFRCWEKIGDKQEGLWRHKFPDGRVLDEAIQYADTQGAIVLLALKDTEGNWVPDSLWSDKAVEFAKRLNDISDPT